MTSCLVNYWSKQAVVRFCIVGACRSLVMTSWWWQDRPARSFSTRPRTTQGPAYTIGWEETHGAAAAAPRTGLVLPALIQPSTAAAQRAIASCYMYRELCHVLIFSLFSTHPSRFFHSPTIQLLIHFSFLSLSAVGRPGIYSLVSCLSHHPGEISPAVILSTVRDSIFDRCSSLPSQKPHTEFHFARCVVFAVVSLREIYYHHYTLVEQHTKYRAPDRNCRT
jgi:hypothetical protein